MRNLFENRTFDVIVNRVFEKDWVEGLIQLIPCIDYHGSGLCKVHSLSMVRQNFLFVFKLNEGVSEDSIVSYIKGELDSDDYVKDLLGNSSIEWGDRFGRPLLFIKSEEGYAATFWFEKYEVTGEISLFFSVKDG